MENFVSSYVSSVKKRSFKSKTLSYNDIIMQSFNFIYAGKVHIFITYQRKKYVVICSGFTYDGVTAFFSDKRYMRLAFDSLYAAVQKFHQCVNLFTDSMDWFGKEYFDSAEFYNFANEELFL